MINEDSLQKRNAAILPHLDERQRRLFAVCQAFLGSPKSTSIPLVKFRVGLEIGFFTDDGYRLNGPTIFSRTSGLVGIVGLFANGTWLNGPTIFS
jgi:hypothetical protein